MTNSVQKFNPLMLKDLMKSEEAPVQHGYGECVKVCNKRHDPYEQGLRNTCYFGCKLTNWDHSQPHLQEPTLYDVKNTLENIGNNFHYLAESVSVL